jgi:hypothetical protein
MYSTRSFTTATVHLLVILHSAAHKQLHTASLCTAVLSTKWRPKWHSTYLAPPDGSFRYLQFLGTFHLASDLIHTSKALYSPCSYMARSTVQSLLLHGQKYCTVPAPTLPEVLYSPCSYMARSTVQSLLLHGQKYCIVPAPTWPEALYSPCSYMTRSTVQSLLLHDQKYCIVPAATWPEALYSPCSYMTTLIPRQLSQNNDCIFLKLYKTKILTPSVTCRVERYCVQTAIRLTPGSVPGTYFQLTGMILMRKSYSDPLWSRRTLLDYTASRHKLQTKNSTHSAPQTADIAAGPRYTCLSGVQCGSFLLLALTSCQPFVRMLTLSKAYPSTS